MISYETIGRSKLTTIFSISCYFSEHLRKLTGMTPPEVKLTSHSILKSWIRYYLLQSNPKNMNLCLLAYIIFYFLVSGVDIVLDPLAGDDSIKSSSLLKHMGRIIHYGEYLESNNSLFNPISSADIFKELLVSQNVLVGLN